MFNSRNRHQTNETPQVMYGFIFNLDGAVVDSTALHVAAWQKALDALGIKKAQEEITSLYYGSGREIARRLLGEQQSAEDIENVCKRQEQFFIENLSPQIQLIDGLKRFLDDAKAMHIPMALTCDSSIELANFVMNRLGLKEYFSAVVSSDEVDRGRPNPDIMLKASLRLGLMPEECIAFDPSEYGIEAAQRAGVQILEIQNANAADAPKHKPTITDYRTLQPSLIYSYSKMA